MASVSLASVSKVFPGGVTAVQDLDLNIQDREFVVLLGPSGCGKSTTLRLIAGLEEVSAGEIRIGERRVNDVAPKDRNIAMVFQNYALYPHMSVYKNMAFGLQLRYGGGWLARSWRRLTNPAEAARQAAGRRGIAAQVRETASVLGIEHLLDRMPRQLSGGERQRVALGRAMVRQPAVFLLDEPLSNLDAKLRLETRRELKQLHRRLEATMIHVTHDQTEALTLGERIAVLDGGRLQQIGTPWEVYERPKNMFVAGFIGTPPMNLVAGRIERQDGRCQFVGGGITLAISDAHREVLQTSKEQKNEVVLGVRPEDVLPVDPAAATAPVARGQVALVESVGDAALVHVEIAAASGDGKNSTSAVVLRTGPRVPLQTGDGVALAIDPRRIHLFDAETHDNLTLAAAHQEPEN